MTDEDFREMEREVEQKRAEAKEIFEFVYGRPPREGECVERCPIDLDDTEDLEILYGILDDLGREKQARESGS